MPGWLVVLCRSVSAEWCVERECVAVCVLFSCQVRVILWRSRFLLPRHSSTSDRTDTTQHSTTLHSAAAPSLSCNCTSHHTHTRETDMLCCVCGCVRCIRQSKLSMLADNIDKVGIALAGKRRDLEAVTVVLQAKMQAVKQAQDRELAKISA